MVSNESKLFVLDWTRIVPGSAETRFSKPEGTLRGPAPMCEACGNYLGMLTWLPPFRVELEYLGEYYGDLGYFMDDILVSERFAQALEADGITGLEVVGPAEIVSVDPTEMAEGMPRYFVARVRRSKAVFDNIASEADYEKRWTCEVCRTAEVMLRHKRVVLVDGTWGGEDLFIAVGLPGVVLTSERFREFCERHAFKNVHLIEASKYSVDWYPGWNPGDEEG
jgi:hypothetical protein